MQQQNPDRIVKYLQKSESSETLYAYAAGVLDGEGCISATSEARRGFQLSVFVGNTDIRLLEWLHQAFGGNPPKATSKPRNPRQNQGYYWRLQGQNSLFFLKAVLPYLVLKHRQTELAVKFLEECSPGMGVRLSPELQVQRQNIFNEIRLLNGRKVQL